MLTITKLPTGDLAVKCHYIYRDRMRKIPGVTFNNSTKQWIVPLFDLGYLEQEFQGEIFYKTPRWVILDEPMPDMSKMYKIERDDIVCPELKLELYNYQRYGVRFMIDKLDKYNFVINCDDVGIGKTAQAIATLLWYIQNRNYKKILIVCKKSAKKQWSDEFDKFTDLRKEGFNIIWTQDTAAKRHKAYKEFENSDKGILITNFHSFLKDYNDLGNMEFDCGVIDEAHVVKARQGVLNNNMSYVFNGLPTIFLTGTPIMSRPMDIFGIVQIAKPQYFGVWQEFSKKYVVWSNTSFGYEPVGAKNLDTLRDMIQDVLIQRTEYEVSVELPDTVNIKIECPMDKTQEEIILAINEEQRDIIAQMEDIEKKAKYYKDKGINYDGANYNKMRLFLDAQSKALIAARQAAATDPRMFHMSNSKSMRDKYSKLIPASYKNSYKTENMLELVESIIENDSKVIIFSKFRTSAILAAQDITKKLKYPVLMYTGTENEMDRVNAVSLFCNTNVYNILIGTDAMAESLNLQVANYEIMIDQPDTWAIKKQRMGRARRVGSKYDKVIVYDLITSNSTKCKSKDEERLDNIEKNKDLSDALISIDDSQRIALINAMDEE